MQKKKSMCFFRRCPLYEASRRSVGLCPPLEKNISEWNVRRLPCTGFGPRTESSGRGECRLQQLEWREAFGTTGIRLPRLTYNNDNLTVLVQLVLYSWRCWFFMFFVDSRFPAWRTRNATWRLCGEKKLVHLELELKILKEKQGTQPPNLF